MEFVIEKVAPRQYELKVGIDAYDDVTDTDRGIMSFLLYLNLTGQLIIDDEIVLLFLKYLKSWRRYSKFLKFLAGE